MNEFVQLLILGMATGTFYASNALGVVVVFRSSRVINFASGGFAMLGGYTAWSLNTQHGWPQIASLPTAIIVAALAGIVVHLVAMRPLATASTLTRAIATLAILIAIQQAIVLKFDATPKLPKPFLPTGSVELGWDITVGADSLLLLAFTASMTGALWLIYRYTRFGLATTALAESPRTLAGLGTRVEFMHVGNWAVGGALAGIAGVGLGPLLQLNPGNFTFLLVPTLAAAIIGELRSFPLTLMGGLLVGALQAEVSRYVSLSGAADASVFVLVVIVLILRGRAIPGRGASQERLPRVGNGTIPWIRLLGVLAGTAALASAVRENWVAGASTTMLVAVVLLSQVVITGYAGQLSLAQLTMSGVGALIAAQLASAHDLPFLAALVMTTVIMIPIGALVGLPSLRARGVGLAIATLSFAVAVNALVLTQSRFAGGVLGLPIPSPTIFGWSFDAITEPRRYFLVCLGLFTVLAIGVANLRRGRVGRRLLAVRSNERAAAALGINVNLAKLYAFVVGTCIAGVGGAMVVFGQVLPQFTGYDPVAGLTTVLFAVLGGIGFLVGPVVGGSFASTGLPNTMMTPWTDQLSWWNAFLPLMVGLAVVAQLIFSPDGLAAPSLPSRLRRRAQAKTGRRIRRELDAAAAGTPRTPHDGVLLQADGLRVQFGAVVVLDDVSIDVRAGEVLGVIGPNGAGKTTLMDALTGFVPTQGSVKLKGNLVSHCAPHMRSRAGLVRSFQTLELLSDMTVLDNLRCAGDRQDLRSLLLDLVWPSRSTLTAHTAAAIDAFGLEPLLAQFPDDLGYGERRLVAIARAISGNPAVVLLDEPASGLSAYERRRVEEVIAILARDWNLGVVLIEHDVELVRRTSDRVVALNFGHVIAHGTADEVLAQPDVIAAYLGPTPPAEASDLARSTSNTTTAH